MVDTEPSVTVVIPALDAASTIERQLCALDRQTYASPFTVVVTDNGSSDHTAVVVAGHEPLGYCLRVVHEPRRGINHARNAGIDVATSDVVVLCDADDEVHETWLAALVDAIEPGVWVGGALDYTRLNSQRTRHVWDAPERSAPNAPADPYVDRTFGCNCGFQRSMWSEIGGFDATLSGAGADENEMFMRAHAAGHRYRDVPDAVVSYRLRPTMRGMARQRFRQGRNQIRMRQRTGGMLLPTQYTRTSTGAELARSLAVLPRYVVRRRFNAWLGTTSRRLGRWWETMVGERALS